MKSFKLFNVKSFKETPDIELKPISIFVGKNSSGKSSLIRFPVILSQTFSQDVYTPFLFFGNLIDYGNYDDVVFNHTGESMKFVFKFEPKDIKRNLLRYARMYGYQINNIIELLGENQDSVISTEVIITKSRKKIIVREFSLLVNNTQIAKVINQDKNKYCLEINRMFNGSEFEDCMDTTVVYPEIIFNKFIPEITFRTQESIQNILKTLLNNDVIENSLIEKASLISQKYMSLGSVVETFTYSENEKVIFEGFERIFKTMIFVASVFNSVYRDIYEFSHQITYIGPFRKDPERVYRETENSFKEVGKNGENATMLLRQAQQSKSPLLNNVSNWFAKSMGYSINIEEIENSNLFRLVVQSENEAKSHNIIDVGYGIAQVLPIVTQVYMNNEAEEDMRRNLYRFRRKRNFIIEQPELHLHPAAQANLADLFVEKVIKEKQSSFLIETHSEHLIRRLQVLIADTSNSLKPSDVAFYYIDKTEHGDSCVKKMELNTKGQFIDQWPSGFFDKGYQLSRQLLQFAGKRDSSED